MEPAEALEPTTFSSALLGCTDVLRAMLSHLDPRTLTIASGCCKSLQEHVNFALQRFWVPTQHLGAPKCQLTFVAAIGNGRILVSDGNKDRTGNPGRLLLFTERQGKYHSTPEPSSLADFRPTGMTIDMSSSSAVVACAESNSIRVVNLACFDATASNFSTQLPSTSQGHALSSTSSRSVVPSSSASESLAFPLGVAQSLGSGRIFVVDSDHHRVVAFGRSNSPSSSCASARPAAETLITHTHAQTDGGSGSALARAPGDLKAEGQLQPLFSFGSESSNPVAGGKCLRDPYGICVRRGIVYITDSSNGRICIFAEGDGRSLGVLTYPTRRSWRERFVDPAGIAFCPRSGQMLVSETGGLLRVFELDDAGLVILREVQRHRLEDKRSASLGGLCIDEASRTLFVVNADLDRGGVHILHPATRTTVRPLVAGSHL
jgi:hypothetical protein